MPAVNGAAADAGGAAAWTLNRLLLQNLWIAATNPVCANGIATSIVRHAAAQSPAVAAAVRKQCDSSADLILYEVLLALGREWGGGTGTNSGNSAHHDASADGADEADVARLDAL
jgi:hypothetical protein